MVLTSNVWYAKKNAANCRIQFWDSPTGGDHSNSISTIGIANLIDSTDWFQGKNAENTSIFYHIS